MRPQPSLALATERAQLRKADALEVCLVSFFRAPTAMLVAPSRLVYLMSQTGSRWPAWTLGAGHGEGGEVGEKGKKMSNQVYSATLWIMTVCRQHLHIKQGGCSAVAIGSPPPFCATTSTVWLSDRGVFVGEDPGRLLRPRRRHRTCDTKHAA